MHRSKKKELIVGSLIFAAAAVAGFAAFSSRRVMGGMRKLREKIGPKRPAERKFDDYDTRHDSLVVHIDRRRKEKDEAAARAFTRIDTI